MKRLLFAGLVVLGIWVCLDLIDYKMGHGSRVLYWKYVLFDRPHFIDHEFIGDGLVGALRVRKQKNPAQGGE